MKKLVTMAVAILLTGCIAAFASGKTPVSRPQQQFDYQLSFSKIVLSDDVNLQLRQSDEKVIEVSGSDADVKNIDWKIKDGVLFIRSKKGSLKDKVSITVNVSDLKELSIKGNSVVSSIDTLSSPSLYVYMNDDCYVAIKNAGAIYLVHNINTEVDIRRISGDVQVGR